MKRYSDNERAGLSFSRLTVRIGFLAIVAMGALGLLVWPSRGVADPADSAIILPSDYSGITGVDTLPSPLPDVARSVILTPAPTDDSVNMLTTATPSPVQPTPTPQAFTAGNENPASGSDQASSPPPSPTPGQLPENVVTSASFATLRESLAAEIAAYADTAEVAIAVTDIQTGETISVNGNRAQRSGCTINLFALLAAVSQFQAGKADPNDVAYSIKIGIGNSYPPEVRNFLSAAFPSYEAGLLKAQQLMTAWGMKASVFDHVPYYGDGSTNNILTALETNDVLAKLYRGEIFDQRWTAYTLARLRDIKTTLNYTLPAQLPNSATVAHKIGYFSDVDGWVDNDAGIVTFAGADGHEKAYAITYLSQKAPTQYAGYSFGARLSGIIWAWFQATYGG